MSTRTSKSTFLYDEVRTALQAGRYVPGERIDPTALAQEFKTSPTPVRFALYRLVGEGMIADHAREGFHVPLTTEVALRDLYDWMQRLLVMACDIGFAPPNRKAQAHEPSAQNADVVMATRELFETIVLSTDHHSLYLAVRQANDRLGPIRRVAQRLLPDSPTELAELTRRWQRRDLKALRSALIAYYARRQLLVPRIVASLGEAPSFPPR